MLKQNKKHVSAGTCSQNVNHAPRTADPKENAYLKMEKRNASASTMLTVTLTATVLVLKRNVLEASVFWTKRGMANVFVGMSPTYPPSTRSARIQMNAPNCDVRIRMEGVPTTKTANTNVFAKMNITTFHCAESMKAAFQHAMMTKSVLKQVTYSIFPQTFSKSLKVKRIRCLNIIYNNLWEGKTIQYKVQIDVCINAEANRFYLFSPQKIFF